MVCGDDNEKTTTPVVVLPTLKSAWITDGTLCANGLTMIH
jgi:hypothetical protein